MIPILFEKTATAFTTNGLGRLPDAISCYVTEQRNGIYELEMEYPVSGANYSNIVPGRIIVCTHNETGDVQPFDIYKISEPINGIVTINACHVSYRLNEITVYPFSATSCSGAIAGLKSNSMNTNPFTFWTDKAVSADYDVAVPSSIRALLGGEENSILDVYGTGEYEFDNFNVKLHVARGTDTEVTIRYGKNLIDFLNDYDISEAYNAVAPFWQGTVTDEYTGESIETVVTLTEGYITSGYSVDSGRTVVVPMDLSNEFDNAPTENELRTRATSKLAASYAWLASRNVTVDFVQLWQTAEYADWAPLQSVNLCDTVLVDVPMYGISGLRIKIITVVWDVLLERYSQMELGDPRQTFSDTVTKQVDAQINEVAQIAKSADASAAAAVTSDTIHYLATSASSGVTTSTPGWTTTIQTITSTNKYLWTYHTYGKANGGTVDTAPVITGVYGNAGPAGASVTGITELYALNDDPDNPPADSAFSANVQTPSASQRYLWNMEQISFSNGTTSNMGKHILLTYTAGIQGRGISSVTEYYAINNSTTAPATSAFTTTVQTPTSSNPYVWNYEVINYTDGLNPTTTDKRIIGVLGQNGTTVTSIQYGTSNSSSTTPTNWSNNPPSTLTKGTWLWVKTTYSDGTTATAKGYIGTDGTNGTSVWVKSSSKVGDVTTVVLTNGTTDTTLTIVDGTDGTNGANGISVTKVEPQYYMSTSSSSLSGGSWSTQLNYITGRYIWTRDEVTYSNTTTTHSTAIYNSALTQAWINANNAYQIAATTDQHFWMTETGADTGAHITEATQADFLDDPANGGGNLLARTNGVAIRDGLSEIAVFSENGILFNQNGTQVAKLGSSGTAISVRVSREVSLSVSWPSSITYSDLTNAVTGTTITVYAHVHYTGEGEARWNDRVFTYTRGTSGGTAVLSYDGNNKFTAGSADYADIQIYAINYYKSTIVQQLVLGEVSNVGNNAIIANKTLNGQAETAFAVDWDGNLSAAGGGSFMGDLSVTAGDITATGNILAANNGIITTHTENKAISSNSITNVTYGAGIYLTAGTYVVIGDWTFNSGSTSGTRNMQVGIYKGLTEVNTTRVLAGGNNFARLQCVAIVELNASDTVRVGAGTSIPYTSSQPTTITAIRIR